MDSSCSDSTFTDNDDKEIRYSSDVSSNSPAKSDDPLEEPIVRISLQEIQISSTQLINMSVKELNKRLASCPPFVVAKLKRCRRTLKNRGYAKNCRIKRIAAKNQLEQINIKLLNENYELKEKNKSLLDRLNQLNAEQVSSSTDLNSSSVSYVSYVNSSNSIPCEQYTKISDVNQNYHLLSYETSLQPCSIVYPCNNQEPYYNNSQQHPQLSLIDSPKSESNNASVAISTPQLTYNMDEWTMRATN